jgi:hypothetical protein
MVVADESLYSLHPRLATRLRPVHVATYNSVGRGAASSAPSARMTTFPQKTRLPRASTVFQLLLRQRCFTESYPADERHHRRVARQGSARETARSSMVKIAQSIARSSDPVWADTAKRNPTVSLEKSAEADVCVVGAGIAGMSAAYQLAREGMSRERRLETSGALAMQITNSQRRSEYQKQ